jgi:PKD repeat protein
MYVDVFDGNTGPLTFFYNNAPVTFEIVGTNQYLINISNPVETAILEIYNASNCGISREITIGNGEPLFDFTSINFQQSATFLAREDITFTDLSENEYDSFEFIYGDGTQSELYERNTPDPIIHEYAISGTYYVTLRIYNDLGCTEELTKTIKVGKGYSILVPNVFTPNGDIWNSTFRPIFNGLSEVTLRIYDSKGGLLHEEVGAVGNDPTVQGISLSGWDGTNDSVSSPYYIYTISGKTIDEEEVFRDGTFIILR